MALEMDAAAAASSGGREREKAKEKKALASLEGWVEYQQAAELLVTRAVADGGGGGVGGGGSGVAGGGAGGGGGGGDAAGRAHALQRPWVLIELFTALRAGIPVVPVLVEGSGYNFDCMQAFLADLPASLEEKSSGALAELQRQLDAMAIPATVHELQQTIASTLPYIISIRFDPTGTENPTLNCP